MKQFDFILANPPYKNGMHMTFLNKAYEKLNETGTLIFIQPSTYFISLKRPLLNKNNRIKFPEKEIISLELFSRGKWFPDIKNDNNLQWAGLVPFSITHVQKNHDNHGIINVKLKDHDKYTKFDSLNKVNIFGDIPEIFSLIDKFKDWENIWENIWNHKKKPNKWFVAISTIQGDFYTIVLDSVKPQLELTKRQNGWKTIWTFSSEEQAINFISYLKTKFARKLLHCLKISQNIARGELMLIPWLDFKQQWTDKKLYQHFKLSEKEINLIEAIIV